ncbi:MAG: HisA/HisF-related TIM barrel protein [Candidatus Omnitrophica bacterium]|nr:HisA/HisF-related TIM barrel protein [Candidatus Omnitrophota bacterium]
MLIIPAIDIISGQVVRLTQGDYKRRTYYSSDPVKTARSFKLAGAGMIHIVDLDGAREGRPINLAVVKSILDDKDINLPLQFGGGIRSRDDIARLLDMGVSRVILGTKAALDLSFTEGIIREYGRRIAISIDSLGPDVMASGWVEGVSKTPFELGREMAAMGAMTIIFTNIKADGTLQGMDKGWFSGLVQSAAPSDVILAGGVSCLDDIKMLIEFSHYQANLRGVITGKAVYEARLDLAQAVRLAEEDKNAD